MKKLEDAVRRFGTPDHGRTAKRLRDFEAALIQTPRPVTVGKVTFGKEILQCCEFMLLDRSCHVHGQLSQNFGVQSREQQFGSEPHEKVIARQYSVIQSLQVLLNQKDEEIDMLRSAPPVRARDLWVAAGLVSLVLLSAYYGFM